jgi:hypothetical protein
MLPLGSWFKTAKDVLQVLSMSRLQKSLCRTPHSRNLFLRKLSFFGDFACNLDFPLGGSSRLSSSNFNRAGDPIPVNEVFDRLKSQSPESNQPVPPEPQDAPSAGSLETCGAKARTLETRGTKTCTLANLAQDLYTCCYRCLRPDHFVRHCTTQSGVGSAFVMVTNEILFSVEGFWLCSMGAKRSDPPAQGRP